MSKEHILASLMERQKLITTCLGDAALIEQINAAAEMMTASFKRGGKLLIFGNGGSAAEAQHFAAELVGRFQKERRALPAIALTTDTSILTAWSNDYSFASVFSRQIEALGKPGDVVVGMTTSDAAANDPHSQNIWQAFTVARAQGLSSVGLFSIKTKNLLSLTDISIQVPHTNTALIQEIQLAAIHMISDLIEQQIT